MLHEPFARALPLGAIQARGWLARQLRIQAEGLSGHLDRFWPDIADSRWFGGEADGWERAPYWLDGFLPLAWTLGDEKLKARAAARVGEILDRQHEDGWLGPKEAHSPGAEQREQYDIWALFLALKLRVQGLDWGQWFELWPITEPIAKGLWSYLGHAVNNAMALREGALWWRLTGDESDRRAARQMVELLDRHHGMPTGVFTGDECPSGLSRAARPRRYRRATSPSAM